MFTRMVTNSFTAKGLEVELKYLNPKFANLFLNFDYVHGDDGDRLPGTDHYNLVVLYM